MGRMMVPTCIDCGELIPSAMTPKRKRCKPCAFKEHARRVAIYQRRDRRLPTPADNGSSGGPSRTAGSAPLEDSFRDAGQVGSKGARP